MQAAADRLTLEVAEATRRLPARAHRLGYVLRESAVLAQAGAVAACRQPVSLCRRQGLNATDRCLDRLATWLGLAERFGDLPPPTVLSLLEELSHFRLELLSLSAAADHWDALPATSDMTLDVNNVSRYASP